MSDGEVQRARVLGHNLGPGITQSSGKEKVRPQPDSKTVPQQAKPLHCYSVVRSKLLKLYIREIVAE